MREYELIADRLAADRPGRVLDWGCGAGPGDSAACSAPRPGRHRPTTTGRVSTRPWCESLEHYPARARRTCPRSRWRCRSRRRASTPCSRAACSSTCRTRTRALDELRRVLAPGGTALRLQAAQPHLLPRGGRALGLQGSGRRSTTTASASHDRVYDERGARGAARAPRLPRPRARRLEHAAADAPRLASRSASPRRSGGLNGALARVPGLRRLATNVDLIADAPALTVRICIVYDCLFPYTVGGAERWYRNLAQRLAADGHDVTYLTLRQWDRGERGEVPGVRVVTAGPRMALYNGPGPAARAAAAGVRRRRALAPAAPRPPLRRRPHLLVPVLLAARGGAGAAAAPLPARRRLVRAVEHRVLARIPRRPAAAGRRDRAEAVPEGAPARVRVRAADRRPAAGRGRARRGAGAARALPRAWSRRPRRCPPSRWSCSPGRHIPEKRAPAVVPAVAWARERVPALRARILGDGPDRGKVLAAIAARARTTSRRPASSPPRRSSATSRARCASCCPRAARATG